MLGAAVFAGGAFTTALAAELDCAEPESFVAVTVTVTVDATSAGASV